MHFLKKNSRGGDVYSGLESIQLGRLIPWLSWPFQESIAVKVIGGKCKQKIAIRISVYWQIEFMKL